MKPLWKVMMTMALLASVIITVPAAVAETGKDDNGIPAYSVARLKIFEGSVWVRPPDSGDWEEYLHNSPVSERSRISVPEGSEAELQFHGGQFMLLTGGTEIDVREMRDDKTDFLIRFGEIRFYLPDADFSPVQVAVSGTGKIDFPVPGQYWVTAGEGRESRLVVRSGEATVRGESGEFPVSAGEEAFIGRDVRVSRYSGDEGGGYEAPPPLTEEEEKANIPPAAAYELRQYGEWISTPEYGYVWRPRVATDWSPYYYGRWVWVSPYGWTWIAYEPWGWYPYHFGYWYNHYTYGWVWYPYHSFISFGFALGYHHGHHHVNHFHRNVYFYTSNARFHRQGRTVRWVPLRPGERYGRARFTRADKRLATWNRPLREGSVFVRRKGERGDVWRDVNVVNRERQRVQASRIDTRLPPGRVEGRTTGPQRVEGSGRGVETRRLERERVPAVRTESREQRPAREIRTGETRPGKVDRPARPRLRNEAPSRGGGKRGSSGRGGTFNRIDRGAERVDRYDRVERRAGTVSEAGRSGGTRGRTDNNRGGTVVRPGGTDRGRSAVSRPGGRSGGVVIRPGGTERGGAVVGRPSGSRDGVRGISRTGGRSSLMGRGDGMGRSDGFGRGGSFGRTGSFGGSFGSGRGRR